MANLVVTIGA
jgi:hypothetical protein